MYGKLDYEKMFQCHLLFLKRPHAQAFLQTIATLFLILVYVEVIGSYIHLQPVQKALHVPTPSLWARICIIV